MCPARHILRDSVVGPCHILLSRQEVMPPPKVGSLPQGSSKGIFFPTGAGFFHVAPRLLQNPNLLAQPHPDSPQNLSPMYPGMAKELIIVERTRSAQG